MNRINLLLISIVTITMLSCGDDEPNNFRIDRTPVDLGLSVKWAPMNIGASEPQAMGGLYGWGDSIGTRKPLNTEYPVTVSYRMVDGREITNVEWGSPYFGGREPLADISGTDYDCARYLWNQEWRLPTKAEWQELIDRCEWTPVSGMEGATGIVYRVTGPNGNSIIIPLGGINTTDINEFRGLVGNYWTSTLLPRSSQAEYDYQSTVACAAWAVNIVPNESVLAKMKPQVRSFSLSVRPVAVK